MSGVSRALVTGGAGFIGSHIVEALLDRGIETVVLDNLSTGSIENLEAVRDNKLLQVVIGDIRSIEKLLRQEEFDVVFHEAAIASVPRSVTHPLQVHNANVNHSLKILNFCLKKKVRRLVFASSAAVYGTIKDPPARELLLCSPSSPYGASKMAVENYLGAFHDTYGLETVALRYFNVYGPRQKISDYSGVITIFINRLLSRERPKIYGDGLQTRDFVHVKDIAQANMLAMESPAAVGEVFNVASGDSVTILKLFEIIRDATQAQGIEPVFSDQRAGDLRWGLASIEKIVNKLGYRPTVTLKEGLNELVERSQATHAIAYA